MDPNIPSEPIKTETPVITQPKLQPPVNEIPSSGSKWKLIIFIIILLIIVGGGAYYLGTRQNKLIVQNQQEQIIPTITQSTPTSTSNPAANWKTYTNTKVGFELKYPPDWKIIEEPPSPDLQTATFILYPPTSDPNLPSDNIFFYIGPTPFSSQPSPEMGMIPYTPITVNGVQGRQTQDNPEGPGRSGGCRYIYRVELPFKNGTVGFSSCISLMSQFQEILKTLVLH